MIYVLSDSEIVKSHCQVAAEHVKVLNSVKVKLPFLVTTGDDVKDSAKEEIRLR